MASVDTAYTAQEILSLYMEYFQSCDTADISDLDFCSFASIEAEVLYAHFESIEKVEQEIWYFILGDALETIAQDAQFESFSENDKLLSLFYTFFESLSLNRSYFLPHWNFRKSLKERRGVLQKMKIPFVGFIHKTIQSTGAQALGIDQLEIVKDVFQKGQKEAFWLQMVCLIEFWSKDVSEGQEKTDVAIEKSVRAAIDLIEVAPVKSLFDLGKFLWQEKRGL